MDHLWFAYPLISAAVLLVIDLTLWQWLHPRWGLWSIRAP